jgi:hypothetical protein
MTEARNPNGQVATRSTRVRSVPNDYSGGGRRRGRNPAAESPVIETGWKQSSPEFCAKPPSKKGARLRA